ncbi:MAG: hypothetical protein V2A79_07225 [Planctomycetota bacterium]
MTELDRQVRKAQVRLWGNRWLVRVCWTTAAVAAAFAILVFICRLYGFEWPLLGTGTGLAGGAVIASLVWSLVGRPDRLVAATALDEAAGLRERVSSGLYCTAATDPFEQAVFEDAQRVAGAVTVRRHLKLRFPRQAVYPGIAVAVAGIMLLLPEGMLERSEARERRELARRVETTRVEVREQLEPIKKIAETNPALKDLKEELERIEQEPPGKLTQPENIRQEALKKVDKLADALRQERGAERFEQLGEMKKMLRRLRAESEGTTQKLTQALAKGDFKAAKEELKQLQDMLATLKQKEDQELVKQLQSQLKDLADQLEKIADDKQLREKLEQAGVKKEDVERMLQNLTKKDLDQLADQLKKSGMSQQQIDKFAKQLQSRQQACSACKQMSQAMSNAASAAGKGDMEGAAGQMQAAGDQLSEMEQLEQEMNQLESQLAQCQNAKNGLGKCSGADKDRPGAGMGQLGQGRGGIAPEDQSGGLGFKIQRQKVHTGEGKIIGQFLVDAEQVKGEVGGKLAEVVAAEERDATDAINRDQIPRQYQKSVKEYFSYVQKALQQTGRPVKSDKDPSSPSSETTEAQGKENPSESTEGDPD